MLKKLKERHPYYNLQFRRTINGTTEEWEFSVCPYLEEKFPHLFKPEPVLFQRVIYDDFVRTGFEPILISEKKFKAIMKKNRGKGWEFFDWGIWKKY